MRILDDIRSNVETRPTYTDGIDKEEGSTTSWKRCTVCSHIPYARGKNELCLAENTPFNPKNDGIARLHDDAAVCLHILAMARIADVNISFAPVAAV